MTKKMETSHFPTQNSNLCTHACTNVFFSGSSHNDSLTCQWMEEERWEGGKGTLLLSSPFISPVLMMESSPGETEFFFLYVHCQRGKTCSAFFFHFCSFIC